MASSPSRCACRQPSIDALYQAAIAICFAFFFDLADGRVARLTKTQSNLGLQLDSLADVISFGVAPALLVYRWGLDALRRVGHRSSPSCSAPRPRCAWRASTCSPCSTTPRQAPGKFIIGLPVPAAAAVLVSLVLLNHQLAGSFVDVGQAALALLVVVLSYLMVSRIRFRSFKDLKFLSRRTALARRRAGGVHRVVLAARMQSAFLFVALLGAYLALGLAEEVVFYRRRRAEERRRAPASAARRRRRQSDEEVLAELGAFDDPPAEGAR